MIAHEFSHILRWRHAAEHPPDRRAERHSCDRPHRLLAHAEHSHNAKQPGKGGGAVLAIFLFGVAMMVIGYIGVFFGKLIKSAVSRQREFLADASAVQFTRNPDGIAGALKKILGLSLGSKSSM